MENSRQITTYFISGHRNITQEEFEKNYGPIIEDIVKNNFAGSIRFIMGDYYGADIMAQNYLIDKLNFQPERICVYHMFDKPRNIHPLIDNRVGGFTSDEERDAAMTRDSHFDIAFVRNHNKWSGTGANILRRNLLK
jgi:hypothetical protein